MAAFMGPLRWAQRGRELQSVAAVAVRVGCMLRFTQGTFAGGASGAPGHFGPMLQGCVAMLVRVNSVLGVGV